MRLSERGWHGAAALVRSGFPISLTMLAVGADLVVLALVGDENLPTWRSWPVPAGVTLVCALWIVVERELAFPGVLVPPGARRTRGLIRARREVRRARADVGEHAVCGAAPPETTT